MINKFPTIHFYAVPCASILWEIPLKMLDKQVLQNIRKLIAKGQLGDALSQLVDIATTNQLSELNELILLSGKYRALEKMELDNRISFENHQKGINQLLRSLMTMIDAFESDLPPKTTTSKLNSTLTDIYKTSIARAKVIEILLAADKGLTIKEVYQLSGLKYRKYIIAALDELIAGEVVERYRLDGDSLNRLVEEKRGIVKRWF